MKPFLSIFLLLLTTLASAKVYFVAPNGVDGPYPSRGTFENPWRTWHYAFNNTTPSDTCYFRGGVYQAYSASIGAKINTNSVDGTHENPTCFFAYPEDYEMGIYPVLDCQIRNTSNFYNIGIELSRCRNIHFRGLTVKNTRQLYPDDFASGIGWYLWSESYTDKYATRNLIFENCVAHNISGVGFKVQQADSVYFINCDAYNCCDSLTAYDPGGNGGGFVIGGSSNIYNFADSCFASLKGCRAWLCSDQGFAFNSKGQIVAEHCWSIGNGNMPFIGNIYNKGSGFKLWYNRIEKKNSIGAIQIIMKNCIAAHNAFMGLNWTDGGEPNYVEIKAHIINNFFYSNSYDPGSFGDAWGFNIYDDNTLDTVGYFDHLYFNNLSYINPTRRDLLDGATNGSNNLFNITGTPVNDNYFQSLDTTGMLGTRTRKNDGSLPEINFGKPAPESPLIDAGKVIFGMDYYGLAPDIGWYETNFGLPAIPSYVASAIENSTPSRLDITFNLSLANIVPAASAFTVRVNSTTRTVNTVAISGTKVLLNLSNPVVYGDVVTVAYTKPSSNPLQTSSGGQAASFTAQNVINNVAAINPVYVNSAIENSTPSRLDITFNLSLANIVPAASAFTVRVNSTTRTVNSVAISGTKVLLNLSSPVVYGDVVTVAYTKPATNPLQTSSGGQATSFSAQNVINNVAAINPVYVSSAIENSTPSRLEITYNLSLANIVPTASAFTVRVNSTTRTVNSVAISGTKVFLNLASPVVYGDVVTVAYTKPATNPLQTSSGGQAASFTAQNVTNNTAAPSNLPPVINISSPIKSESFIAPANITVDAVASDPDGSISKVEFFNGTTKLGETNSAPYYFVWKEVPAGNYSLTAVATDNLNYKTTSEPVTIVVEKSSSVVNQVPNVAIKFPNKDKKFKPHDNIVIEVEASDPDGTITKVELKNGTITLAELTSAPYRYIIQNADTGLYHITAAATDNAGATSVSSVLEFTVEISLIETSSYYNIYPNPNHGQFFLETLNELAGICNSYAITNLSGEIIYKKSVSDGDFPQEIDMSGSASGTYILIIMKNNNIIATKKIIKK